MCYSFAVGGQERRGFGLNTPQACFPFPHANVLDNLAGKFKWSKDISLLQLW